MMAMVKVEAAAWPPLTFLRKSLQGLRSNCPSTFLPQARRLSGDELWGIQALSGLGPLEAELRWLFLCMLGLGKSAQGREAEQSSRMQGMAWAQQQLNIGLLHGTEAGNVTTSLLLLTGSGLP